MPSLFQILVLLLLFSCAYTESPFSDSSAMKGRGLSLGVPQDNALGTELDLDNASVTRQLQESNASKEFKAEAKEKAEKAAQKIMKCYQKCDRVAMKKCYTNYTKRYWTESQCKECYKKAYKKCDKNCYTCHKKDHKKSSPEPKNVTLKPKTSTSEGIDSAPGYYAKRASVPGYYANKESVPGYYANKDSIPGGYYGSSPSIQG